MVKAALNSVTNSGVNGTKIENSTGSVTNSLCILGESFNILSFHAPLL